MSANIGRMAYTGQIPWHGLGKKVDHAMTWAEALVAAGLDWKVAKSPVLYKPEFAPTGKVAGEVPSQFNGRAVTYRTDNGSPLGIVSSGYPIVQNVDVGRTLEAFIGEKDGAHFETAGYLGEGEKVWALIKIPGVLRIVGDDVVEKYLLCANSHDGSLAFWVIETPIRVVCENTLMSAITTRGEGSFRASHDASGMHIDIKDIRAKLGYAEEKFSVLEQAYKKMVSVKVSDSDVKEYFKRTIEYPKPVLVKDDDPTSLEDQASGRMKNRLNDLLELLEVGKGADLPGVRGSVWGAYNAITEYADFFNGKSDSSRAQSTLFGAGAQLKTRAFEGALALSK